MNHRQVLHGSRRGSAIPLSLLAVVVLLVMGTGLLRLGLDSRIFATRTASAVAARSAADAGLTKALFVVNEQLGTGALDPDNLPTASDEPVPGTDETFSYSVTGDGAGGYVLESTGRSGIAEKSVSTTVRFEGPFEYALFVDEWMELKAKSTIDWLGTPPQGQTLAIATNSTTGSAIKLKNKSYINGDIFVGVGGDPDTVVSGHHGSTVTGSIAPLPEERTLSSVTVPAWLEALPITSTITSTETISSSGKYAAIDLKKDAVITIDGAVTLYVTGDITLRKSCEIKISTTNPNASLVLYVGGNIDGKNCSGFNNLTQNAGRLKLFALDTCTQIVLHNSADLYGAIYAPRASVDLKNGAIICGSLVAKSYVQRNSAVFLYPFVLRNATSVEPMTKLKIKTWTEK